nr:immunoglobulin heavy chain junction region [Mus musculus]
CARHEGGKLFDYW